MRGLIVGASGQDGRILSKQLEERGYSVLGISRSGTKALHCTWSDPVDICNEEDVRHVVNTFRPDELYFLAAYHHSSQDPTSREVEVWTMSWTVHVEAFKYFLESIRIIGLPTRIFLASSSRIFGMPATSPQTEQTPYNPVCVYGITKVTAMMLAKHYRELHGVWVSTGILYNHESQYRDGCFVSKKVAATLVAIKRGRESRLEVGRLDAQVDWGYAPDYTHAMQLILSAEVPDDFIVATGKIHTVQDMIEIAARYLDLDWRKVVVENPALLQRPSFPLLGDASRLRERTGWIPSTGFQRMVEILIRDAEKSV
jgi:GDPmannose 4,6-dehydratase